MRELSGESVEGVAHYAMLGVAQNLVLLVGFVLNICAGQDVPTGLKGGIPR